MDFRKITAIALAPLSWAFRVVVGLVILFEEWGWPILGRWMAAIAQLPILRQLEHFLKALPPYGALAALVLPSLVLLPIKLCAVWLLAHGYAGFGVAVVILAKLAGTAVLAWLFQLIQPSLMTLPWFAQLYRRWLAWKAELIAWVRASVAWRVSRGVKRQARMLARHLRKIIKL